MGPFAIHIFGVFAILALAWALFFLWLIGLAIRGLWIGLQRISGRPRRGVGFLSLPRRCTRLRCLTENPPQANFCRRCGAPLARPIQGPRSARNGCDRWVSSPSRL